MDIQYPWRTSELGRISIWRGWNAHFQDDILTQLDCDVISSIAWMFVQTIWNSVLPIKTHNLGLTQNTFALLAFSMCRDFWNTIHLKIKFTDVGPFQKFQVSQNFSLFSPQKYFHAVARLSWLAGFQHSWWRAVQSRSSPKLLFCPPCAGQFCRPWQELP